MATQTVCSFGRRLLHWTSHMEWFVPRRLTTNVFNRFSGLNTHVSEAKPFSTLQLLGKYSGSQKHDSLRNCQEALCSDCAYSSNVAVCQHVKGASTPKPSAISCGCVYNLRRDFSTAALSYSQFGMGQDRGGESRASSVAANDWALKLANENGYLSWCRNTYLATVVAIAMMGEGTTAMALHAAEAAFFVAGVNLSWGTYQYVYNLLHLRPRTGMSAVGAFLYVSMASLHLALWFIVCSLYLGYSDDEEEEKDTETKANKIGNNK